MQSKELIAVCISISLVLNIYLLFTHFESKLNRALTSEHSSKLKSDIEMLASVVGLLGPHRQDLSGMKIEQLREKCFGVPWETAHPNLPKPVSELELGSYCFYFSSSENLERLGGLLRSS